MLWLESLKHLLKSTPEKIRAFWRCQRWKETLIFSFFLLLSLGFWVLQSLQQEYEIELRIPVRLKHVSPQIAFTDTVPSHVAVRVKDKGSVLLNYSFNRHFAPIEADLKEATKQKGSFTIARKQIESDILKQLFASTSMVGFEPQRITLNYNAKAQKKIPVRFSGTIQTETGFHPSGELFITPSLVDVYAGAEMLDSITVIETTFTTITNGNETITQNIPLKRQNGATYNPESVVVTIPIEEYTDKTLEIPVQCTDLPAQYRLRMFPAVVKVTCNVPLSRFKELSAKHLAIRVSFADLEHNMSGTYQVNLSTKPEWVRTATLAPDKIEFILEQGKL